MTKELFIILSFISLTWVGMSLMGSTDDVPTTPTDPVDPNYEYGAKIKDQIIVHEMYTDEKGNLKYPEGSAEGLNS